MLPRHGVCVIVAKSCFINNCKICISVYYCVNISSILISLIVKYYLTRISLLFFIVGLRANQHLYPVLGQGRPGGNIGRDTEADVRR